MTIQINNSKKVRRWSAGYFRPLSDILWGLRFRKEKCPSKYERKESRCNQLLTINTNNEGLI